MLPFLVQNNLYLSSLMLSVSFSVISKAYMYTLEGSEKAYLIEPISSPAAQTFLGKMSVA